jgi:hypothetical protein
MYVSIHFLQIHINLFVEITFIEVTLQNSFIVSYNDIGDELKENV